MSECRIKHRTRSLTSSSWPLDEEFGIFPVGLKTKARSFLPNSATYPFLIAPLAAAQPASRRSGEIACCYAAWFGHNAVCREAIECAGRHKCGPAILLDAAYIDETGASAVSTRCAIIGGNGTSRRRCSQTGRCMIGRAMAPMHYGRLRVDIAIRASGRRCCGRCHLAIPAMAAAMAGCRYDRRAYTFTIFIASLDLSGVPPSGATPIHAWCRAMIGEATDGRAEAV